MVKHEAIIAALAVAACAPNATAQQQGVPASSGLPAGVKVFADPVTGCEYLLLYNDSITPRYEAGGRGGVGRVKGCRS